MFKSILDKLERMALAGERQATAVENYMEAAMEAAHESAKASIQSQRHGEVAERLRITELQIREMELADIKQIVEQRTISST